MEPNTTKEAFSVIVNAINSNTLDSDVRSGLEALFRIGETDISPQVTFSPEMLETLGLDPKRIGPSELIVMPPFEEEGDLPLTQESAFEVIKNADDAGALGQEKKTSLIILLQQNARRKIIESTARDPNALLMADPTGAEKKNEKEDSAGDKEAESAETAPASFSRLCEDHNRKKAELASAKSAIQKVLKETLLKGLEGVDFVSHKTIYSKPGHPDFRDLEMGDGSGLITFYLGKTSGKLSEPEENSVAEWLSENIGNELLTFRFLQKEGIFRCEVSVSAIDRLLARENRDAEPK